MRLSATIGSFYAILITLLLGALVAIRGWTSHVPLMPDVILEGANLLFLWPGFMAAWAILGDNGTSLQHALLGTAFSLPLNLLVGLTLGTAFGYLCKRLAAPAPNR